MIGLFFKPRLPPLPNGYMWRKIGGEWRQVCDTCGGNCGQCGDTGKLGNVPADMDFIIKKTGMNKIR